MCLDFQCHLSKQCPLNLYIPNIYLLIWYWIVYIILSLWVAKDGKRKYRSGGRELLVHALSDNGIGVEPIVDPRIASLKATNDDKVDTNVILVSPLFAALHGLRHGDLCHARRVKHTSVLIDTVSLLPLCPLDSYDQKELVDCLLSKAHIVQQDSLILISYPKPSQSAEQALPTSTLDIKKGTSSSKALGSDSSDLLSKQYLGFIVLDAGQVCQGVLTRKTTIFIAPFSSPSPAPLSPTNGVHSQQQFDTILHELYYTSLCHGALSGKLKSASLEKLSPQPLLGASATSNSSQNLQASLNGTPNKPLMRSSMLVVPLGSPFSSPLSASNALSSSIRSPKSATGLASDAVYELGASKSYLKTPTTRGTTPSLSPSSTASSIADSHRDVLNRSFLRVEILTAPLAKVVPKISETPPSHASGLHHCFDKDATLEVGVSLETLKQQMVGVFNSSWVEVIVSPGIGSFAANSGAASISNALGEPKRQLARIYVMEGATDFTLYVPPTLAFNLALDPQINTTLAKVSPALFVEPFLKDTTQLSHQIRKIESLHFALVSQPHNPHYNLSSKALVSFFSQPRIMRQGEVFAVIVKKPRFADAFENPLLGEVDDSEVHAADEALEDIEEHYEAPRDSYQIVHFKINSIRFAPTVAGSLEYENPYYGYIPAKPNAISDGLVHSRIPPGNETYLLNSLRQPIASISKRLSNTGNAIERGDSPAGLAEPFSELLSICRPCLHPMSASFGLSASVLIHGARGSGKTRVARQVATILGISIFEVNCFELIGHTDVETEKNLRECFEEASTYTPVLMLLSEFEAFETTKPEASAEPPIANAIKEQLLSLPSVHQRTGHPIMVVATVQNASEISRNLRSLFRVEIGLSSPDESSRLAMLQDVFGGVQGGTPLHRSVRLQTVATKTASFQRKALESLAQKSREAALRRVLNFQRERLKKTKRATEIIASMEMDIVCAGIAVTSDDIDEALEVMHAANATTLGTPKIPQVKWEDVGGLLEAKREILDTIQLPLQHPELFAKGASTRSGILLYGPPGTGKTLLAKAVATECSLNFISVKGPELINMYIGESEKNVREVFQRARDAKPCVIFFDELDSLAPNRGRNGDSGGVMDRIVSQLLAELSDMAQKTDVFVIGATNRPDLIDPALLVPGRFDKLIFLGVNAEVSQKHNVLTALTRKFALAPSVNLMEIARMCPVNLTGADLYALCSDAMATAIKSQIQSLQMLSQEKLDQLKRDEANLPISVEQSHFITALKQLTPSVSMEELERYKDMANKFQKKDH